MTLLHISTTRDRALVATDTAVYVCDRGEPGADVLYYADGVAVAANKIHALPHIRAVLIGRGTSSVHAFAVERIRLARDFEHAVELLADELPRLALAPSLAGTYKGKPLQHSVHLVAWSDAHNSMCRASFESASGYRPTITPASSGWQGLYDPFVSHPTWVFDPAQSEARADERRAYFEAERERDPRCLKTAAAYARHAVEYARSQDPRAPFGGRLLAAELTRDSVQIVDAGDLGLPHRRAGADDLIAPMSPVRCIQPGSATTVVSDFIATKSQAFTIGALGVRQDQVSNSLSYTNDTSGSVSVEVVWSANHKLTMSATPTGSMSANGAFIQWTVNGTPAGYSDPTGFDVPSIAHSQTASWRMAGSHTITLAAGDALVLSTVVQYQGTVGLAGTLDTTNSAVRLTVVKR